MGREKDLHPLVHYPNGCNARGWAGLKPGAQNCILVSHMDVDFPLLSQAH